MLGIIQGINLWLVYEISLVVLLRFSIKNSYKLHLGAFLIAVSSFFGAVNLTEIGGTMGDNIISIPILLSFLLLMLAIGKSHVWVNNHTRLVKFLAYLLAGISVGLKITVAPFAFSLLLFEVANSRKIQAS